MSVGDVFCPGVCYAVNLESPTVLCSPFTCLSFCLRCFSFRTNSRKLDQFHSLPTGRFLLKLFFMTRINAKDLLSLFCTPRTGGEDCVLQSSYRCAVLGYANLRLSIPKKRDCENIKFTVISKFLLDRYHVA